MLKRVGVVKNKGSCYPLINDRRSFPGSMALIFMPVRYIRPSVVVEPQHPSQSLITVLIKQQGGLSATSESPPQLYFFLIGGISLNPTA